MKCAEDSYEILVDIITELRDLKETKEIREFIDELERLFDEHRGECVFQSFLSLIQQNKIRNLSDPRYIQATQMLSLRPSVFTDRKSEAVYIPRITLQAFRELNELYNAGRLDPENSAHAEFLAFKQLQQQRQQRRLGGKKKSGKKGGKKSHKKGGKKSHKKGGKKSHKRRH
jgi:hypothetical protein